MPPKKENAQEDRRILLLWAQLLRSAGAIEPANCWNAQEDMRQIYALVLFTLYGGTIGILWPLRTWIFHIIERPKPPEFTIEKALAEDTAEGEASPALRSPLAEDHWAWGEASLFAVRLRMMAKVPCDLAIADLWEYNIDLDADAYQILAFCPLAMSGQDEPHGFFNLYELRLDKNEAYKWALAIANQAVTWNSDLDFEVFDVKWDETA